MQRLLFVFALTAGVCLLSAAQAQAGVTPSKGLKVDSLLQQAIIETAEPESTEETTEELPVFGPERPPEPAIAEETPLPPEDETIVAEPVVIESEPEPKRALFKWPEEPGMMWGGVRFLPSILARVGWNDNLYARDIGREADVVTQLMPRLRLEIPDIRHDVALEGAWEHRRHAENRDEDVNNGNARFSGQLNAERGLSVPFDFSWAHGHEERQDDLAQQLAQHPIGTDDFKAESGIRFKPGAFGIALLGQYHKQRFEDGRAMITNAPVIRRDADRDMAQIQFHTTFDLDPENSLVLWGTYGTRDYDRQNFQAGGFTGPKRSSDTFSGMFSWMFGYADMNGHMTLGLEDFNYESAAIQDVREWVGDMEIDYNVGEMTTMNIQAARSIEEDDEVIDPLIRTRLGLYLEHQPWDDVLVAAGTDYNFLEFNNSGRDDETWDFRTIFDYFVNDFLSFGAEYSYTLRDSEATGLDFDRNLFMVRARGRL